MTGVLPKVGGLTILASASDEEAEFVIAGAGFGANGFGKVGVEEASMANMLVEAVVGLGEKRLDEVDTSLGANEFGGEDTDALPGKEAVLGVNEFEDCMLVPETKRLEGV